MFLEKKQTLGHALNHLCFLGLLKGFVFFYFIIIDCFWQRLTSLQINPWFWVALLIRIKMSRKHFPWWCSYCLLSEAIPSEERNYFAYPWFLDVEHYQTAQLMTQADLDYLLCRVHSRFKYFLSHSPFSSVSLFVCITAAQLKHQPHDAVSLGSILIFTGHIQSKQHVQTFFLKNPPDPGWIFTCIHGSAKNTMAF